MTKPFVEQTLRRRHAPQKGQHRIWEPAQVGSPLPPPPPQIPGLMLPETRGGGWMSRCEIPFLKIFPRTLGEISRWDVVELKQDVGRWAAGTRAEVMVDEGALKVVRILDEQRRLLALAEVPEEELELLERYTS